MQRAKAMPLPAVDEVMSAEIAALSFCAGAAGKSRAFCPRSTE
jgi:hypothetical protein